MWRCVYLHGHHRYILEIRVAYPQDNVVNMRKLVNVKGGNDHVQIRNIDNAKGR